jgi:ATP-dependent helicase/nuclease subunit A
MDKPKMVLNKEQQKAAYCEENTVVAAGAGSGKTSVLASRYAYLVTEKNYQVDQILTLTFTRKAAAEMYQRIYHTLADIAANDTGIKQKSARDAVNGFFNARISTLDSYSASIVKQAASRYGIRPDFVVDKERCEVLAAEEALPFLIARRHHPAIRKLYRGKGPAKLAQELFADTVSTYSHIDEPPNFIAEVRKQFDIICGEWSRTVSIITVKLQQLVQFASNSEEDKFLNSLTPLLEPVITGNFIFPDRTELRSYFDSLLQLTDTECIDKAEKDPLQKRIFQSLEYLYQFKILNLQVGKKNGAVNTAKLITREIRNLFGTFSSLAVFCMQAGIILSLMSLLEDFQTIYLDKKRAEGVLTFTDVARLARSILINHPDIRDNEKNAFKAIMIDEFQDNNALQKDLLFLLAEKSGRKEKSVPAAADINPGKLFFVGDEKQSIYRFRGADVSVFRTLQEELSAAALPLSTNYRSSPALIGAFNALFGGSEFDPSGEKPLGIYDSVFVPTTSDSAGFQDGVPLPPYEAQYTPLRADKKDIGQIGIYILDKRARTDEEGGDSGEPENNDGDAELLKSDENEAIFTAEHIGKILDEGKYSPDDIAILFRAHGPQKVFEKHLRLLNIPYASEGISGFFSDGPVNDMLAALRLVAYPLDTEAYAVMLRSPFVGLSMKGLAVCLAKCQEIKAESGETPEPFSEEIPTLLDEADRLQFTRGRELYQRICRKSEKSGIGELVSQLWYTEGYRYETEWNTQTAVYRELYDYLFNLAVKADEETMSLAGFTDKLRSLQESGERLEDMDIPLERSGAVHIMTIHKSKGLEFPVVFLCCCGKHGRNNGNDAEVYASASSSNGGISFNPPLPPECSGMADVKRNFFYEQDRLEEKQKQTAELRRLLYVAMTRAEKELYVSGSLSFGKDNDDTGDLYQRLKIAIDTKLQNQQEKYKKEGVEQIRGDTILDDDTLFGLLLPAVAARIPDEAAPDADSSGLFVFLTLQSIPVYTEERIKNRERREVVYTNNRRGLLTFLTDADPFYQKACTITTPEIVNKHRTPTSFHSADGNDTADLEAIAGFYAKSGGRSFTTSALSAKTVAVHSGDAIHTNGAASPDIFGKVDRILKRFLQREESFSPADFGAIAHACVEALLNKREAAIPARLGGHLSLAEADTLLAAGKELAERFLQSPLGKIAASAKIRKSEYQFRSLIKNMAAAPGAAAPEGAGNLPNAATAAGKTTDLFINGTIDLLFTEGDTVHVVDFKTDSSENPAEHAPQMAFYYRAATELTGKKCRIWLYYLRTGHAVEMFSMSAGPGGKTGGAWQQKTLF